MKPRCDRPLAPVRQLREDKLAEPGLPPRWSEDTDAGLLVHDSGELQLESAILREASECDIARYVSHARDYLALVLNEQERRVLRRARDLGLAPDLGPGPEAA